MGSDLQYTPWRLSVKMAREKVGDERGRNMLWAGRDEAKPLDSPGSPPRPLLEALLFFSVVWLGAFLPLGSGGAPSIASPAWHLGILATLVPAGALLAYLMSRAEGLAAFGVRIGLRPSELAGALVLLGIAWLVALLPDLATRILAPAAEAPNNPLLEGLGRPSTSPLLLIPVVLLSCLATGYVEELYFRVYLLRRLAQGGFRGWDSILFSSLLFGLAHGSQGPLGALVASLLGAIFALRWRAARSWHEIALGHAFYDFSVLLVFFYA
jgi:membrane protease YdiL (CAAX protease family)